MSVSIREIESLERLAKAGPFIGPRGGKWADAKHTIPYKEGGASGGSSTAEPPPHNRKEKKDSWKYSRKAAFALGAALGFLGDAAKVIGKILAPLGPELLALLSMGTHTPAPKRKEARETTGKKDASKKGKTTSGKEIPELDVMGEEDDFYEATKGWSTEDHRSAAAEILANRMDVTSKDAAKHNAQAHLHITHVFMNEGHSYGEASKKADYAMSATHRTFSNEAHRSAEEQAAHKKIANIHSLKSKEDSESKAHVDAIESALSGVESEEDQSKIKSYLTAKFLGETQASLGAISSESGLSKDQVAGAEKRYAESMGSAGMVNVPWQGWKEDPRKGSKAKKSVSYVDIEALDLISKSVLARDKLSEKISKLVKEGYSQKQAVAIAHKMLGVDKGGKEDGPGQSCDDDYPKKPHVAGKDYPDLLKEEEN